jgi:type II secretory pathway component PulK
MTLLHDAMTEKKLDTRVLERNVSRGVIRAEDAQKAAKELPDDAANAEFVSVDELAANGDTGARA